MFIMYLCMFLTAEQETGKVELSLSTFVETLHLVDNDIVRVWF